MTARQSGKAELDPAVHELVRRTQKIRRAWVKRPDLSYIYNDILDYYHWNLFNGTKHADINVNTLHPVPAYGDPRRRLFASLHLAAGPIGLLLTSIFNVGSVIDLQWQTHAPNEVPIEVRHTAYNHLTFHVGELAVRARTFTAPMRDTFGGQVPEIDTDVLHKARDALTANDMIIANYIATGGVWGQHNKRNAGDDVDHHCLHCGARYQDFFYTLCECHAVKPTRDKHLASNLGGLDLSKLPKPLLLGLPPALCPNPLHT